MATKNQIAQTIWIMETMQIIRAKSHKQNCLEQTWQERVGMTVKTAQTRMNTGFLTCHFALWYWIDTIRFNPVTQENDCKGQANRPAERQIQQGGFACPIFLFSRVHSISILSRHRRYSANYFPCKVSFAFRSVMSVTRLSRGLSAEKSRFSRYTSSSCGRPIRASKIYSTPSSRISLLSPRRAFGRLGGR